MKKQLLFVGALATTLSLGCFLAPKTIKAATPTTQAEEENNDYYVLPNGEHFLTKRTLKNGKTLEFYDISVVDSKGEFLKLKARYDGEEFQYDQLYVKDDTQVKQLETYFPALTATKKVDSLIQKYKDPSKSTLPDSVDKTSELYLDMKSCADEAIKDCKTDYEKIITLDRYVHKIITYDLNSKGISMEKAWKEKKGVCDQIAQIMQRLCQIENIPADYVYGKNHACVLSYDSQNKKWIYSDPTNYCEDLDVYGRANAIDCLIENPINLKYNNNYFSLVYDKTHTLKGDDFYEHWDEMENWAIKLTGTSDDSTTVNLTDTELEGIPIEEISGEGFNNNTTLKSFTAPASLKQLETFTFYNCSSLEEIDLSNTKITEIPNGAFNGCTSLKTVKLPNTITKIGDKAFYDCNALTEIEGLDQCRLSSIGSKAFVRCKNLTSLNFSQSTFTQLEDEQFTGLTKLKSVILPDSLTTLPAKAFYGDSSLESIKFPSSLDEIGDSALYGCKSVKSLDFSNTALTKVGSKALANMNELTEIKFSHALDSIGTDAFSLFSTDDLVPTVIIGVQFNEIGYKGDNTAPWRKRYLDFADEGESYTTTRFYGNGSTGGTGVEPNITFSNSRYTIPECTYTKSGYLFISWNTMADGSGKSYKVGTTTTTPPEKLYAQWKKAKYTINYVFPGATMSLYGDTYEDNCTRTYTFSKVNDPAKYLPTKSDVKKDGYKFLGWYKDENFTGSAILKMDFSTAEDMTLYAKWQYDADHTHKWENGICTICGEHCTHPSTKMVGSKPATCKEEGYTGNKMCNDCGATVETGTTLPKTDAHDWDEGTLTKSPTCNTAGERTKTCKVCGRQETEVIPATGEHQWEEEITKKPTCSQDGEKALTCKVCGKTEIKTIPATGLHEWGEWQITLAPTCTKTGEHVRTCQTCGKKETSTLPATGHSPEKESGTPATCDKAGKEGNTVCSKCGKLLETGNTIPATGHSWSNWQTTESPTCNTAGEKERTCQTCGKKETESIPATGIHDWDEGTLAQSPTCTEDGKKVFTCKTCSETKIETLPATGHSPEKQKDTTATCTKAGKEGNTVCSVCGEILKTGKTIKATGHSWDSGKITKKASYTKTGIKTYTCKKCGEKKSQTITKLAPPKAGTKLSISGNQYTVTKAGSEVSFSQANTKAKSVTIPNTVTVSGITYKVTGIKANAFKNCKKLTTVTIGTSVRGIASKAFNNCPKLKKVTIKTVLLTKKTASKKAFNKVNKKVILKVPAKAKKSYKKIFKGLTVK